MKINRFSNQFKKDLRLMEKRGKNISKFQEIAIKILNETPIDEKYKPHKLIGKYKGMIECHIEPDWLLIWEETEEMVYFTRTGSHSDLF